ncbi:replication protein a3 [Anaeramoeba ignava]|uniref:Replication protein a3 n=1 Tax=Anaeramoeba ignava TaxID=1746090 RepID=A0A9Q0LSV4_ANAIG|nr:replication protein a3 [Anaeramoeba ignava]|eukprot:Anaeramoba_ignava/a220425_5.p1 GENE.a220425_5~~a220425_5.p1  ORF type:complete len:111 (-),score=46.16 a220425_5:236-568(-)
MQFLTQRVNHSMLKDQVGKSVRFVGKVTHLQGNEAKLLSPDSVEVSIIREPNSLKYSSDFVEVVGTVNSNLSIKESQFVNFGNNFDLQTYNEMLQLSTQFPEIFQPDKQN